MAKTLANPGLAKAAGGSREETIALLEQALAEYTDIADLHGQALASENLRQLKAKLEG